MCEPGGDPILATVGALCCPNETEMNLLLSLSFSGSAWEFEPDLGAFSRDLEKNFHQLG
jgi:hypothetical protein